MAGPTLTPGTIGNAISQTPLLASGTQTGYVDFLGPGLGGDIGLEVTAGGTVAATYGCRMDIYPIRDSTPNYDTVALMSYTLASYTAGQTVGKTVRVPTGKYKIVVTNLDATNQLASVKVTSSPLG